MRGMPGEGERENRRGGKVAVDLGVQVLLLLAGYVGIGEAEVLAKTSRLHQCLCEHLVLPDIFHHQ